MAVPCALWTTAVLDLGGGQALPEQTARSRDHETSPLLVDCPLKEGTFLASFLMYTYLYDVSLIVQHIQIVSGLYLPFFTKSNISNIILTLGN